MGLNFVFAREKQIRNLVIGTIGILALLFLSLPGHAGGAAPPPHGAPPYGEPPPGSGETRGSNVPRDASTKVPSASDWDKLLDSLPPRSSGTSSQAGWEGGRSGEPGGSNVDRRDKTRPGCPCYEFWNFQTGKCEPDKRPQKGAGVCR